MKSVFQSASFLIDMRKSFVFFFISITVRNFEKMSDTGTDEGFQNMSETCADEDREKEEADFQSLSVWCRRNFIRLRETVRDMWLDTVIRKEMDALSKSVAHLGEQLILALASDKKARLPNLQEWKKEFNKMVEETGECCCYFLNFIHFIFFCDK